MIEQGWQDVSLLANAAGLPQALVWVTLGMVGLWARSREKRVRRTPLCAQPLTGEMAARRDRIAEGLAGAENMVSSSHVQEPADPTNSPGVL